MAFSESFGLGNSTFMNLETEVKIALKKEQINPTSNIEAPIHCPNPLDIIDESPTNSKSKPNKSRSRHHVSQFGVQRKKKFQKSRSESTLQNIPSNAMELCKSKNTTKDDNYSEFFKSEFSIEQSRTNTNKPTLIVNTSQVEAAFKSHNEEDPTAGFGFGESKMFSEISNLNINEDICDVNISEALDVPIFSSDIQGILNSSSLSKDDSLKISDLSDDDWKDSLKFSEFHNESNQEAGLQENSINEVQRVGKTVETEEIFNIDDATFICPDEDGKDFAEKTINEIKVEVHQALQEHEGQEPSVFNLSKNSSAKKSGLPELELNAITPESIEDIPNSTNPNEEYKIKGDLEDLKRISAWNLPKSVLKEYEKKGIRKMFDWQIECLSNPKVLFEHCNLVYSAPTSAGKTLVSEILLIKTILERSKKVIIILPFISVVREKMFYLQDLLIPSGYRVEGFFGGYSPPGGFDSINVAICTIEKANSIINKLLEQGKLDQIGTVVVDEIHLISDPGRGYILELLIAKVLYMSRKHDLHIQIITMSATLANVELLKKWLGAELYITDYRPVALQEMIKIGKKIYNNNLEFIREINTSDFEAVKDQDHVAQLCIETLSEGCSVIVFCPSKDWCENLSVQLAAAIHAIGRSGSEIGNKLRSNIKRDAIEEVKKQLKDIPTGLDSVLEKTINYACAFHHAGLTTEERDIIEACFKNGALKIIVATSTLSSGVNLPARRVIIRSPLFGGKQMSSLTYKQMIGRAGRTGKDTLGESILICADTNARTGKDLVCAPLNPISSCLGLESSTHLKRALLEVISSGVATTKSDIENFVTCTLLSTQKQFNEKNEDEEEENDKSKNFIFESIDFLIEYEFVRLQHDEEKDIHSYVATRLGMACLASSMPPTDGLILFSELQKSRRCFVLESELHAVYLVTPYSVCYQLQDLDWLMFLDLWEKLSPAMKKVGELVGVKESFLVRAMRGQTKLDYKLMQIHKRFYTALALQELVNETPVNKVAIKYKCTRGMLQSLQQMASTFAGIVTAFCNSLNWSMLSLIVGQFKERLFFGVHRDLIDLMRLPDLNYKRARVLFDAGIQSLVDLANTDIFTVEKILHNSLSFDTAKKLENEDQYENNQRNNFRNFYITGKVGLTVKEAAKMLVDDARQFVQYEIGVGNINWSQDKAKQVDNLDESSCLESSKDAATLKRKTETNCSDASPPKLKKIESGMSAASSEQPIVQRSEIEKVVEIGNNSNGNKRDKFQNILESGVTGNLLKAQEDHCSTKNAHISKKISENGLMPKQTMKNSPPLNKVIQSSKNQSEDHQTPKATSTKKAPRAVYPDPICGFNGNTGENTTPWRKHSTENENQKRMNPNQQTFKKPPQTHLLKSNEKKNGTPSRKSKEENENEKRANTNLPIVKEPPQTRPTKSLFQTKSNVDGLNSIKPEANENKMKESDLVHHSNAASCSNAKTKSEVRNVNSLQGKENKIQSAPNSIPPIKNGHSKKHAGHEQLQSEKISLLNKEAKETSNPTVRRSPRNHLPSSTRIEKSTNNFHENDLFNDEVSFEMNSEIVNAMDAKQQQQHPRKSLNKSSDEIAASQEMTFQPKTQSTRLLRSYKERSEIQAKTPARRTPLRRPSERDSTPPPLQQDPPVEPQKNKSNTLEVSDISLGNSLMQNPIQLNSSHILSTSKTDPDALSLECIQILDICGSHMLFKNAIKELLASKTLGLSLGIEKQAGKQKPLIGANLLINQVGNNCNNMEADMDFQIDDSSFVAGVSMVIKENVSFFLNLQNENTGKGVTKEMKIDALKELCKNTELTLQIYDAKEHLKILRQVIPTIDEIRCKIEDPKVANWLLQPDKAMSFAHMAQMFAPECKGLVKLTGSSRGYNSIALDTSSAIFGKVRSSVEACVTMHILREQVENLERIGTGQLHKFFIDLEMPLQKSLCEMECHGFPANESKMRKLFQEMTDTLKKLESKIYETHGSRFNLGSASAVARVVGLHRKGNGRVSTSKQILEKIDSPIAHMIVVYRKLSVTLTKNIQPLLRCIVDNRIRSNSITFTSTGRISMQEPNLQNVAKCFEVVIGSSEKLTISCRSSFCPPNGRCLVSADFCQLEMRILAHLSQDPPLLRVMNSDKDVFTAIAAKWNKVQENDVSEELRNGTKQICYGIVYGMGMRALSESLKCSEQEAKTVSEQFHSAYPGIRLYTEKVIKFARQHGYVETITGRRRHLDNINSGEPQLKNQAERQAINSTIQGSAADIAKSAILRMEKNVGKYREKMGLTSRCVNLVLHLHDELIFEVPEDKAKKVAKVLSITMENCVRLSVPLKVKLKIGKSWGDLKEVKL